MFFSKISGLWREEDRIFIRGEYHNIKFHINEIATIHIADWNDSEYTINDLPLRKAKLLFLLKSGRKKTCYVRNLTMRKYKWLLKMMDT